MKNAAQILTDLRRQGIEPQLLDGNMLGFPAGVLTDEQRQVIRQHKLKIIALLRAEAAGDPALADDWRAAAARYYSHHFGCRRCIAAGQNPSLSHCGIGLPLWESFKAAHAAEEEKPCSH